MGAWKKVLIHVAWSGLFVSGLPGTTLQVAAQQANVSDKQQEVIAASSGSPLIATGEAQASVGEPALTELPDSPGTIAAKAQNSDTKEQRWELASAVPQASVAPQPAHSQSSSSQQENAPQKPVGTAAAEAPNATGIAASQPAGVAIAPAKQRRVRTIMLRMGAIVGAGVAVGSVVALTAATSSKPPGAH